jgi:hypothetical protein
LPPATSARPLGSRATPTIARAAVSRFGRLHAGAFLHRENISHSQGRKGRHRAGKVQKGDAGQQVAVLARARRLLRDCGETTIGPSPPTGAPLPPGTSSG